MKAVIFDMDGTIVDSIKFHNEAWKQAFSKYDLHFDTKILYLQEGIPSHDFVLEISKKKNFNLSEEQINEICKLKKEIMADIYEFQIYDNIKSVFDFLKSKDVRLSVVTGADKSLAHEVIDKHLPGYFDVIVTAADTIQGKPHPDPYLKGLEKLGLEASDCIVIENAPLGVESAKACGITTFALETTLTKDDLTNADIVFPTHKDMLEFFEENF